MSNKKGENRHDKKMIKSSLDDILLFSMIEEKFIDYAGTFQRVNGEPLKPPPDIKPELLRWRRARLRHRCTRCGSGVFAFNNQTQNILLRKSTGMPICANCGHHGDYRHTAAELESSKVVAEWLATENAKLRNQPIPEITWRPER